MQFILGDVGLSGTDLNYVSEGLSKNKSLTDLRMNGNKLDDSSELMASFAEAISDHGMLTMLNLSGCTIADAGTSCTCIHTCDSMKISRVYFENKKLFVVRKRISVFGFYADQSHSFRDGVPGQQQHQR